MNEELKKVVINIGYRASSELSNKLWSLLVQTNTVRELFRLGAMRTKDSEIKALARKMFELLPDTRRYYENPCSAPWYERESAVLDEGTLVLLLQLGDNTKLMTSFEEMFKSIHNCVCYESLEGVYLAKEINRLQKYFGEWKVLRLRYIDDYMAPIEGEFGMYFRD